MPKIASTLPKLRQAQISRLELLFGFDKWPTTYRGWLLRHNGGRPTPAYFDWNHPTEGKLTSEVSRFLGFDPSPLDSEVRPPDLVSVTLRYRGELPKDALAIGFVEPEDVLLLQIGGKQKGLISILLSNETLRQKQTVFAVANSFKDFLNGIRAAPELTGAG